MPFGLLEASHEAKPRPWPGPQLHPKPTEQQAQHVQEGINSVTKHRADAACDTASQGCPTQHTKELMCSL